MRVASAQTAATTPTTIMSTVRAIGARASSPSRERSGGRIRARPLPTTSAPPRASTNHGSRSLPRKTSASTDGHLRDSGAGGYAGAKHEHTCADDQEAAGHRGDGRGLGQEQPPEKHDAGRLEVAE